jgi:hypothetical protein
VDHHRGRHGGDLQRRELHHQHAELDKCIAGRVLTWVFPKPKGGGVAVVTYPFVFKQAGE